MKKVFLCECDETMTNPPKTGMVGFWATNDEGRGVWMRLGEPAFIKVSDERSVTLDTLVGFITLARDSSGANCLKVGDKLLMFKEIVK